MEEKKVFFYGPNCSSLSRIRFKQQNTRHLLPLPPLLVHSKGGIVVCPPPSVGDEILMGRGGGVELVCPQQITGHLQLFIPSFVIQLTHTALTK